MSATPHDDRAPSLADFLLARIAEDERDSWIMGEGGGRMRDECEAKRGIVEHHKPLGDEFVLCSICTEVGPDAQMWPCNTLLLLALPYADHDEYREEWRP